MKTINEKIIYRRGSLLIAILLGCLTLTLSLLISMVLQFDLVHNLVMSWILTTCYTITAFLVVDRQVVKEKEITDIVEVEKQIMHIVPQIEREYVTIDNPVVHVVDRPVEKKVYVKVPVEKKIYVEKPKKKLNIPKYNFIGSNETKMYHKRSCRFRGMIKRKNKVCGNTEFYFTRKGFTPCKNCLK